MTAVIEPLHIEAVGLANVRFFRPLSGGREYPFVAIEDLFVAMVIPRGVRRHLVTSLRSSVWSTSIRTANTAGGPVMIIPHFMCQGLVDAMAEVGRAPADFYVRYAAAGANALGKLTAGLHGEDLLAYIEKRQPARCGMTGRILPFPPPCDQDLIEVTRDAGRWSVTIASPDQMPLTLAEFDTRENAEEFGRHVADVRGSTSVITRRPA